MIAVSLESDDRYNSRITIKLAKARDELPAYFAAEPKHHFFIGTEDEETGEVDDQGEGAAFEGQSFE